MRTQSRDTSEEAEQRQVELLRAAGSRARFAAMRSLTESAVSLSRRALRRTGRFRDETEVNLAFVELAYGPEQARAVREYLARRRR